MTQVDLITQTTNCSSTSPLSSSSSTATTTMIDDNNLILLDQDQLVEIDESLGAFIALQPSSTSTPNSTTTDQQQLIHVRINNGQEQSPQDQLKAKSATPKTTISLLPNSVVTRSCSTSPNGATPMPLNLFDDEDDDEDELDDSIDINECRILNHRQHQQTSSTLNECDNVTLTLVSNDNQVSSMKSIVVQVTPPSATNGTITSNNLNGVDHQHHDDLIFNSESIFNFPDMSVNDDYLTTDLFVDNWPFVSNSSLSLANVVTADGTDPNELLNVGGTSTKSDNDDLQKQKQQQQQQRRQQRQQQQKNCNLTQSHCSPTNSSLSSPCASSSDGSSIIVNDHRNRRHGHSSPISSMDQLMKPISSSTNETGPNDTVGSNHYTIINDYDLDAELIGNNGLLIDSGNCSLNSFSPDSLTSAGAGNGLGLALTIGNGSSTTSSTSSMINTMTLTNGSSTSTNCNKGIIHSQSSRTNNTPFMSDISLDNLLANWEVSATTSQTMINSLDEACTNHSSAPNETSSPTSIVLASSSSMLHSIVPSQSHSQQFSTLQQQSGNVTIVGNVSNEKTRQQSQTRNVNGNNSRKRLIQPMSSSAVTYSNRRSLNNKVNASNSSSLSTSSSTTTESLSTLGSKVSSSSTQLSPTSTSTLRSTSTNQLMSSTSTAAERASTSPKTAATSNHIISNDSTNFNQHGNNNNNINMKRLKMRQVEENVPLTSVVSSGLTISTISFRSNGGNSIANNNGMNNQSINVTLNGNHSQSSSTLTNNNNSTNGQYMSSATPGTGTRNSRMIDTEISDEERRLLTKEGYPTFPSNPAALTKVEEKILRKIRRKIRNKRSAQSSRQRKKEYVEELERRCAESINMSQFYKKECVRLRRELAEFHRRFQRFNLLSANTVLSSDHSRLACGPLLHQNLNCEQQQHHQQTQQQQQQQQQTPIDSLLELKINNPNIDDDDDDIGSFSLITPSMINTNGNGGELDFIDDDDICHRMIEHNFTDMIDDDDDDDDDDLLDDNMKMNEHDDNDDGMDDDNGDEDDNDNDDNENENEKKSSIEQMVSSIGIAATSSNRRSINRGRRSWSTNGTNQRKTSQTVKQNARQQTQTRAANSNNQQQQQQQQQQQKTKWKLATLSAPVVTC